MNDELTPNDHVDPEVIALVEEFIARVQTGRAVKALRLILDTGAVTTDDLKAAGYEHPPRAIADVRDQGIPIITNKIRSKSGKQMAIYSFGTAEQIQVGQSGRTNFSKKFKKALLDTYENKDSITGATHTSGALQIDHRVPYRVGGDANIDDVTAFMLLDGKSQRSKSWACEHCANFTEIKDTAICQTCFWAYPENYEHVAMENIRRADLVWQGDEVEDYVSISNSAEQQGLSVSDHLKSLGRAG